MKIKYCAVEFEDGTVIMNQRKGGFKRSVRCWQRNAWTPEEAKVKRFFKWIEEKEIEK